MVLGWCGLGRVALGARHLALYRRDEVVIAAVLVVLLLLLEPRGRPFVVVHDLLPLALRGVEHRGDCFFTIGMVARNVEELAGRARHAAPKSVDEGRARRAVLECRNGVIVGCIGELGAALGEASYVLAETLPRLLLAVAQLSLLTGAHIGALDIPDEDPT
jgi:hypothetical protein